MEKNILKTLYQTKAHKEDTYLRGRVIDVSDDTIIIENMTGIHRIKASNTIEIQSGSIVEIANNGTIYPLVIPEKSILKYPTDIYKHLHSDKRPLEMLRLKLNLRDKIKCFFVNQGFIELETPLLVASPGVETHIDGFKTHWNYNDTELYLPTSPELSIKKALSAGIENVFEITRGFRNGPEVDQLHQPEFNILEWYRAYTDYRDIMNDTEELIEYIAPSLKNEGLKIDCTPPYERLALKDAFQRFASFDLEKSINNDKYLHNQSKSLLGDNYRKDDCFEDLFFKIMTEFIEPHLGFQKPVIVYDYPMQMSSLSMQNKDNPLFCERFELYIRGIEIANAFTELNDPDEQLARFNKVCARKKILKRDVPTIDYEFIECLKVGFPPAGGIALGIERLIAALLGLKDISRLFLLPKY